MISEALSSFGFGAGNLSELLGPFVREVRVRVWWDGNLSEAEENGTEIVLTTHVFDPSGAAAAEGAGPSPGEAAPGPPPQVGGR